VAGFDSTTSMDRDELARWVLDDRPEAARITGQEWLAVLYLLTTKVRTKAAEISEWVHLSRAYDVVLSKARLSKSDRGLPTHGEAWLHDMSEDGDHARTGRRRGGTNAMFWCGCWVRLRECTRNRDHRCGEGWRGRGRKR
jgi:hypothetical protein